MTTRLLAVLLLTGATPAFAIGPMDKSERWSYTKRPATTASIKPSGDPTPKKGSCDCMRSHSGEAPHGHVGGGSDGRDG